MIFFGYAQTPWNRVHATRGGRVLADVEAKREQLRTRATEATKEVVGMGGSKSHFTVKCVICNLSEFEAGCQGSGMEFSHDDVMMIFELYHFHVQTTFDYFWETGRATLI